MRTSVLVVVALVAGGWLAGPAFLQSLGPTGPSPYEVVENWVTPFADEGFAFGGNSGVFPESPDRIFVVQRGETKLPDPVPPGFAGFVGSIGINALRGEGRTWQNCIYIVDGDGNLIDVWDQWDHLFEGSDGPGPHRIRISPYDPERRVWVVHETGNQVFVFSNDGSELLMTLGEKDMPGDDETHFGKPQDVGFLPDGRILIADGIDNSRVVIYDAEMNYITEFGGSGNGRGEFNRVHSLATGPDGRIFVADRDNQRVQVFNETTRSATWYHPNISPIAVWPGFDLPLDIIVNDYNVWVTDVGGGTATVVKLDLNGNGLYSWDLPTEGPGAFLEMHSFGVDTDGNLYGADNQHGRVHKLVPKPDADPTLLISTPWVAATD
jgi:hypothetical protein